MLTKGLVNKQASLVAQLEKNPRAIQETWFDSWVGKIPWRRDRLHTPIFLGFPVGSGSKEFTYNAGDLASIPRLGRFPGGLAWKIPMDRGDWLAFVHGVAKS